VTRDSKLGEHVHSFDPAVGEGPAPRPQVSRLHLAMLVLIALTGLARGLFWSAATEVFSPVDEAHHYAYVATVAEELRIPVMGRDLVPLEVLEIRKESPTLGARTLPRRADLADGSWGAELEQYEALQPPLYYLVAAPVYRAANGLGPGVTVFALRAFTVVLSILAVPLTWGLSRRIFPGHPGIWLAAPALLVVVNGFNANLATVTNDALVPVMGTALLLAGLRFFHSPSLSRAAALGGVVGLSILTKLVLIAIIPMVGVLFIPLLRRSRYGIVPALRAGAVCALVAAAVTAPWFAWNIATYEAPTAAGHHYEIIGPYLTQSEFSLGTLRSHLRDAHAALWRSELRPSGGPTYELAWDIALLAGVAVGIAGVVFGLRRREMAWVLWLSVGIPLSFLISEATFFLLFDGRGQTVGRYLYGALPAACIVLCAWPFVMAGSRLGWTGVAAVAALALSAEVPVTRHYISSAYTGGILVSGELPVVDQSLNQGSTTTSAMQADPPCPVTTVGIALAGEPPLALQLITPRGTHEAVRTQTAGFDLLLQGGAPQLTLYRPPEPLTEAFSISSNEPLEVYAAASLQPGAPQFADQSGSPVIRLYCQVRDAASTRFDQTYPPLHPVPMSLRSALAWPALWRTAGLLALLAALAAGPASRLRRVWPKDRDR